MEGIADAGEIALSPALAGRLDRRLAAGPGRTRRSSSPSSRKRRDERAPDVGDVSGIDIADVYSRRGAGHVLLDRSEPEHRTITAGFIDLLGIDELLATLGPGVLAADLDERLWTIQEAALTVRRAVLRDRYRQGQRQGAADGWCAVGYGSGRGADAARAS